MVRGETYIIGGSKWNELVKVLNSLPEQLIHKDCDTLIEQSLT